MTDPASEPDAFLPYMPDVARCELSLRELSQMWHLIEASAKMNCPVEARLLLPAVIATRTGFAELERALVADLVHEKVRNILAEIGTKAHYAIDILVRNLFERTADVGFLATDSDLCRFVAGLEGNRAQAQARLSAYRDKYSVYDEILLLDPEGRVLVQTDPSMPVACSSDALIAESLARDGYIETFRASDLRPGKPRALIYSHRMRHPESGAPVGVLCLCFNFEQELAAIFDTYRDPGQRANMLLLDAQDTVISSADPLWIPPGIRVPTNLAGKAELYTFSGREYLVSTFVSGGYQGYPGPSGWKGQLMIPVDLAFRAKRGGAIGPIAPQMLQGHSFSPELHALKTSVSRITRAIERIVWNGKVTSASTEGQGRLNTILDQITEAGARSDALFSRSIEDLYQTVLASRMRAAEYTSQLLIDMLDRNLYERANDCRWWALSASLRRGLALPGDPDQAAAMHAVLGHINGLYTVYSRLFVYDRKGRIVACTGAQDVLGSQIDAATLSHVFALRSDRDHYAEPFGPAALYDGQLTFIYHAAIRHPDQANTVVGGIGIVFNSTDELRNMLDSGVAARPNMQAFFVTPTGRVLASTDPARPPGAQLEFDGDLLQAAAAGQASVLRVKVERGQYCIAACTRATGYREFRAIAQREEPVLAVLLESFGDARSAAPVGAALAAVTIEPGRDRGRLYAAFFANGALMAIAAAQVLEAVPFAKVQRVAGGSGMRIGMLDRPILGQPSGIVWVVDLAFLINGSNTAVSEHSQIILVQHGSAAVGLLVDDLHSVHLFDDEDMSSSPLGSDQQALSHRLIKANRGNLLLEEICVERLFARIRALAAPDQRAQSGLRPR